ncbi:hypothetical protein L6304_01610 [bacterium]|nr:hypothetical protein [bacterium]
MSTKWARIIGIILILTVIVLILFYRFGPKPCPIILRYPAEGIDFLFRKSALTKKEKLALINIYSPAEKEAARGKIVEEHIIAPGAGLSNVRIGNTYEQVLETLEKPKCEWRLEELTSLMYANGKLVLTILLKNDIVDKIFIFLKYPGRTREGIKLGDSKEKVLSIYGEPPKSKATMLPTVVHCAIYFYDPLCAIICSALIALGIYWSNKLIKIKRRSQVIQFIISALAGSFGAIAGYLIYALAIGIGFISFFRFVILVLGSTFSLSTIIFVFLITLGISLGSRLTKRKK